LGSGSTLPVAPVTELDAVNNPLSIDSSARTIPIKNPMTTTTTTIPSTVKIHRNRAKELPAAEAGAVDDVLENSVVVICHSS
jgi:hypothetical protein